MPGAIFLTRLVLGQVEQKFYVLNKLFIWLQMCLTNLKSKIGEIICIGSNPNFKIYVLHIFH